MIVKISTRAQKQIEEIYRYYFVNETPLRADKIINSFFEEFESCKLNPYKFPKAKSKSGNHHIRKGIIHQTFVFRYHVYPTYIRVITIIHGKRIK